MRYSELALRYASALYSISKEKGSQDATFAELKALNELIQKNKDIKLFLESPLYKAADKEKSLSASLENQKISDDVKNFVLVLARKNRLSIFSEVLSAFEAQRDREHGVTRGSVESTGVLSAEERKEVDKFVSEATNKKVILSYSENPDLIGGLVARVGSYTFDDSLSSHLNRLKDQLNRSVH